MAVVGSPGKYRYIDKTGAYAISTQYLLASSFAEGLASVCVHFTQNQFAFIDKTGKIVLPAQAGYYAGDFSEGLAKVKIAGKIGFIDQTGKLVIPAQFVDAEPFSNGMSVVNIKGKYGFIDKTGKLVIPAKFDEVNPRWLL